MDWLQLEGACMSVHGHLVSLDSSSEEALMKALAPTGSNLALGLREWATDGYWYWSDRVYTSHRNWATGHPVLGVNDTDCAFIYGGGPWQDILCASYGHPFVCEIPMNCP